MSDFLKEVAADADLVLPDENKLSRLTELARTQLTIQQEIEDLQIQIDGRKEALRKVSERDIPELMHEIGAREVKLLDGHKLSIKPFYSGKITSPECYTWLESNGYADIVKTDVIISYRMSEADKTDKVRQLLHDNGIQWDEHSGVHHSTLNAAIKDIISSGAPIDRGLFSVYTGFRASIK